ncbi:MAG: sugar phosphate isomerase/epimerase [Eubacteriales bacterium]|nr:sugar phosphate isomerase/epimerase [Clostridiales bacterium]MDD7775090.1 sugar phosphate isomerase/epimerase [Eubacteriales bacterium]MDY3941035.1 sugar phosphate isomerase/epimerase [Eubacteriales bacterium]
MALPVGVQLYSIRDSVEADMHAALAKVKELGYDGVEFAGLYGNKPADIRAWCAELGLNPISAHVPLDDMLADTEGTLAAYKEIGVRFVVVPYVTEERRPGAAKFDETIAEIARIGKIAADMGLTLLYHNHDFEFKKVDGEYGLDILYKKVPAAYLQTELDTCWVNVGGENPADFVRKYTGRAPVVHLKDFHMSGKLPQHLYALIGLDDDKQDNEPSTFEFRPCGCGMQDMPAILAASVDAGAKWVIVEQDEPSMGLSRMECIAKSRENLRKLGW